MSELKTLGSGEKIATPTLAKMFKDKLMEDIIAVDEAILKTGMQQKRSKSCGVCKGSGFDPEDKMSCIACEGTGTDFEIIYGVEDGQLFAYTKQYGIDAFKEMCKACREAEAERGYKDRVNRSMILAFRLPAVVEMELQSRGYTLEEISGGGERGKEVAKVVQTEFPEFMCTNLRY